MAQNIGQFEVDVVPNLKRFGPELAAAARALKIEVPVSFDVKQADLVRTVQSAKVAISRSGAASIQIEGDLDETQLLAEIKKAQAIVKSANADIKVGVDQRGSRSFLTWLRGLRDDFSTLDATATRVFRSIGLGFTALVGVAAVSFGAIATIGIKKFAELELGANKASQVFATNILGERTVQGLKTTANQLAGINREIRADIIETAREVGIQTAFSSAEVAEGIRAMAQAGVPLKVSLEAISTAAQLAQTEELDLIDVSERLTSAFIASGGSINDFGQDIGKFADQIAFASDASQTSIDELTKGLTNKAAATFAQGGQDVAETINALGILARTGLTGLKAGTGLDIAFRDILTKSADPEFAAVWKKYGIEVRNAKGEVKSFAEIADDFYDAFAKHTDNFRKGNAQQLRAELGLQQKSFGALAQLTQGVGALRKENSSAVKELEKLYAQSSGRLAAKAQLALDTFHARFEQFRESVGKTLAIFGESAAGKLTKFFDQLNKKGADGISTFDKLNAQAAIFGDRFGESLEKFLNQLAGPEGKAFFSDLTEGFRRTLNGIKGFFVEMAVAFSDGETRQKTFLEVLGILAREFGKFAEEVLPRVGAALGKFLDFVKDNPELVKEITKAFAAFLVISKAIRIIVLPLAGGLKKVAGGIAAIRLAAAGDGIFGRLIGSLKELQKNGSLVLGPLRGIRWEFARSDGAVGKLIKSFGRLNVWLSIIIGAFEVAEGFLEELKRQFADSPEIEALRSGLKDVNKELESIGVNAESVGAVLKLFGERASSALEMPLKILRGFGGTLASWFSLGFKSRIDSIRIIFNLLTGDVEGAKNAFGDLKDAVVDAFGGIVRGAILPFIEILDDMFEDLSGWIGIPDEMGEKLDPLIEKIKGMGSAEDDTSEATGNLIGSLTSLTDAVGTTSGAVGKGVQYWEKAITGLNTVVTDASFRSAESWKSAATGINTSVGALLPPGLADIIYPKGNKIGQSAAQGVKDGVVQKTPEAVAAAAGMVEKIDREFIMGRVKVANNAIAFAVENINMVKEAFQRRALVGNITEALEEVRKDVENISKTLIGVRRAAFRVIHAMRIGIGRQATLLARKLADTVLALGQVAIRNVRVITPQLILAGAEIVKAIVNGIKAGVILASVSVVQQGKILMAFFRQGMAIYTATVIYPFAKAISESTGKRLAAGRLNAHDAGVKVMTGFFNGLNFIYLNKVQPLIEDIAEWIFLNKGPLSYDQTLLRPAGEAIMMGFHSGLQDGFSEIKGWVKEVGPYVADLVDTDMFFNRSAHFLLGNAKADLAFDPHTMFDDLLPNIPLGLHPTTGLADTTAMAKKIADFYNWAISSILRPGAITSSGNVSQHALGEAADFVGGGGLGSWIEGAKALSLLIDKVFKQIITNNSLWGNGSPFGYVGGHMDHIHLGWMRAGARRHGGPTNMGSPYLVGEDGPELFIPHSRGNVMTNRDFQLLVHQLDGAKKGGAQRVVQYLNTQNISSNASDPRAVAAQVDANIRSQLQQVSRD